MSFTQSEIQAQLTTPGGLFEVEEIGETGVRAWKHAPANFRALLEISRLHGEEIFLVYRDERLTFEEHFRRAATLSRRLIEDYGVAKGDRVAIAMHNCPEWAIAFSAILAAGAIAVPLNAWWTKQELAYGVADSGARVLIVDGARAERLQPTGLSLIIGRGNVPEGSRTLEELIGSLEEELPHVELSPDDPATIFYTSGTTGLPKGALGSHRNICQTPITAAYSAIRSAMPAGADPAARADPRRTTLLSVPLFHVTGCFSALTSVMFTGGRLVLMNKWDVSHALSLIEAEGVNTLIGVPTNAWQLIGHPDLAKHDLSSLTTLGYGGAPAPPKLLERIKQNLPGRTVINGYGMTETSARAISNGGLDYHVKPDSIGYPSAVVDVCVVDEMGNDLGANEVGELCLRGPSVITGYWNKPEATVQTLVNGWLRTGDLARIDEDGFVYIVDRLKDVVIRGGENVYSAEVEAALLEHAAIDDAAVIGVPHDALGEEVGVVICLKRGASVCDEDLRSFLSKRIANFKIPVHYWFRETKLPRNPAGKILKTHLRREVLDRDE
ncbi:class I adenylate-forming enzyme family protein [Nonomuraea glycinis]|uniref:class I adenylate-forming enzyme family protein n=1 Tax=Nonomuraea glycinis TaxID=2047744 RepID=UPI0033B76370